MPKTIGIDELDFWLSEVYMMVDHFLYGAGMDYRVRDETAVELHYKFRRVFTPEMIRERIDIMLLDPESFFSRVMHLRNQKIPWPWEVEPKKTEKRVEARPDVAISQELLIEITNLVHFMEDWKVMELMQLARQHFLVRFDSHDYFVHQLLAEVVKTKFFMVGTCNSIYFALFIAPEDAKLPGIDSDSWWYEEEPEPGVLSAHAPLPLCDGYNEIVPTMEAIGAQFVVSIDDSNFVKVADRNVPLLRHVGRISSYRRQLTGWHLQVLQAMERSGNRNAKFALQRAFE